MAARIQRVQSREIGRGDTNCDGRAHMAAIVVFIIETFELSHKDLEVAAPFLTAQGLFVVFLLVFFVNTACAANQSARIHALV